MVTIKYWLYLQGFLEHDCAFDEFRILQLSLAQNTLP